MIMNLYLNEWMNTEYDMNWYTSCIIQSCAYILVSHSNFVYASLDCHITSRSACQCRCKTPRGPKRNSYADWFLDPLPLCETTGHDLTTYQ